jgi:hypothetical protein
MWFQSNLSLARRTLGGASGGQLDCLQQPGDPDYCWKYAATTGHADAQTRAEAALALRQDRRTAPRKQVRSLPSQHDAKRDRPAPNS